MKALAVCCLVIALLSAGCLSIGPFVVDPPVYLLKTTRPQRAVFYVPVGWCGGIGTPILDAHDEPVTMNGDPVVIADETAIHKRAENPRSPIEPKRYRVTARIHMEKCRGPNHSLPPQFWGIEKDYYSVVIDELLDVKGEFAD
jgi:hypothetical protein